MGPTSFYRTAGHAPVKAIPSWSLAPSLDPALVGDEWQYGRSDQDTGEAVLRSQLRSPRCSRCCPVVDVLRALSCVFSVYSELQRTVCIGGACANSAQSPRDAERATKYRGPMGNLRPLSEHLARWEHNQSARGSLQYVKLDLRFRREHDLSLTDMALLSLVESLSRRSGWCYASRGYVARSLGISTRTVQRSLARLRKKRLVEGRRRLRPRFPKS